jgi:hypothetical protein
MPARSLAQSLSPTDLRDHGGSPNRDRELETARKPAQALTFR